MRFLSQLAKVTKIRLSGKVLSLKNTVPHIGYSSTQCIPPSAVRAYAKTLFFGRSTPCPYALYAFWLIIMRKIYIFMHFHPLILAKNENCHTGDGCHGCGNSLFCPKGRAYLAFVNPSHDPAVRSRRRHMWEHLGHRSCPMWWADRSPLQRADLPLLRWAERSPLRYLSWRACRSYPVQVCQAPADLCRIPP